MTKKRILAALLILLLTGTAFAEFELGFGIAPPLTPPDETRTPEGDDYSDGFWYNNTGIFHFGYSFAWLFYASVDALILPPTAVSNMTGSFDVANGTFANGVYSPGILSLIDVGLRPRIGPIMLMVSMGINNLYIYNQDELEEQDVYSPEMGVNLRAGLGYKLGKALSIMASGTTVFSNFKTMVSTLKALQDERLREMALETMLSNLYPAIVINLHL